MINFTLTDLRYLIALSEELHFAKAAEKCFVSQPTLSIAIKKLEENLGVTIFERQNHGLLVTNIGQKILNQAKKVLNESSLIEQIAKSGLNPYYDPFRIGAIFTIGPYIFPRLVQHVRNKLPDLKLILEENYTHELLQKLLDGELDAIILATKEDNSELVQIDLFQDKLNLICEKQNELAKHNIIKPEFLQQESFLLLGSGHCLRDQIIETCPKSSNNSQFGELITSSSIETIKHMVEMNLGVSVLPEIAQDNLPPNILIKQFGRKSSYRTISIAYRKTSIRQEIIDTLIPMLTAYH